MEGMMLRRGFRPTVSLWGRAGEKGALSTGLSAGGEFIHTSAGLLDPCGQLLHKVVDRPVLADQPCDLGGRVDHGGVVAASELAPDLRQRRVSQLAREVHRDLAWIDDVLGAALSAELLQREPEAVGDELLDPLDRDLRDLAL